MNTAKLQISEWFIFYSIQAQGPFEKIFGGGIQKASLQRRIGSSWVFKSWNLISYSVLVISMLRYVQFSILGRISDKVLAIVQALNAIGIDERKRNQWEILGEALKETVKRTYCKFSGIVMVRSRTTFPLIFYLSKFWRFLHTNSHMSLLLELEEEKGQRSDKSKE